MSVLDIVITIIILIGLWRGYRNGFIRTVIGFFGWFVALVAGTRLADSIAPLMSGFVDSPVLQSALGFIVVILVVMTAIQFASLLASRAVDTLKLNFLDKFAGGALGAAKNLLIILVIFSFSAPILVKMSAWEESILAPELIQYAPHAKQLVVAMYTEAWDQIDQP